MRSRWQGFLQVPQYSLTFTWNVLFKQIMMLGQLVLYSRDNWNAIIQCSMRIIVTALWIGPYIFIYIKCYHSCMLWIITKSLIVITLLPRVQIFHKNKNYPIICSSVLADRIQSQFHAQNFLLHLMVHFILEKWELVSIQILLHLGDAEILVYDKEEDNPGNSRLQSNIWRL